MQIHEVTKRSLRENVLSNIASGVLGANIPGNQASIERDVAASAEKLRAQGYGQDKPELDPQQAIAGVQQNTAQQQYIKGLVAQWQKDAPKTEPAPVSAKPVAPAQATPGTDASTAKTKGLSKPGVKVEPTPSITIGSVGRLTKGDGGLWYNEKGQPVTDPAQVAKIDKAFKDQEYRRKQFQQTAMVREAPEEYTTTGGIVVPGGAKSDQKSTTAPDSTAYRSHFENWAAKKILTKEPVTRQTITLDAVKSSAIGNDLEQALNQVVATAGDSQKNAEAVKNYLTMAVAGVVIKTQELRAKNTGGGAGEARVGQGIVTQQELRNRLSQEVGINSKQLDSLKKLGQDPAVRQAMSKFFGV